MCPLVRITSALCRLDEGAPAESGVAADAIDEMQINRMAPVTALVFFQQTMRARPRLGG
jgi:hypothetical protein